jgi:3-deoxy-D-manno-octulosonic-acid transferase
LFLESFQALALVKQAGIAMDSVAARKTPRLLVVPRHPQRFDDVATLAARHGLRVSRRSQWLDAGPAACPSALAADVWLGDSLGDMPLYYALADVALLGGSFAPLGGQNLIEAAACACPVVMGPHTFNFADAAAQAEACGAAQRAPDMAAGLAQALKLVDHPAAQASAAAAATAFGASNRGATARTVAALQAIR